MINSSRLISMERKWYKLAAIGRRRISLSDRRDGVTEQCVRSVAKKGHFVIYTSDKRRFVIPLAYLSNSIFRKLLEMAEEEFGLPGDGPITLPCEATFLEYFISLVERRVSEDLEKALLMSMASTSRCSVLSSYNPQGRNRSQLLIEGF